jgi:hypothetical protein
MAEDLLGGLDHRLLLLLLLDFEAGEGVAATTGSSSSDDPNCSSSSSLRLIGFFLCWREGGGRGVEDPRFVLLLPLLALRFGFVAFFHSLASSSSEASTEEALKESSSADSSSSSLDSSGAFKDRFAGIFFLVSRGGDRAAADAVVVAAVVLVGGGDQSSWRYSSWADRSTVPTASNTESGCLRVPRRGISSTPFGVNTSNNRIAIQIKDVEQECSAKMQQTAGSSAPRAKSHGTDPWF